MEILNEVIATDAGMIGIWISSAFTALGNQDAWEDIFLDDEAIVRLITRGKLVPINIGGDGSFQIVVRIGHIGQQEDLSEREKRFVFLSSQAYLLSVDGKVCISGIEDISGIVHDDLYCFNLEENEYSVVIYMVDWEAEPGMKDADGSPSGDALPDFVVIINPAASGETVFRTKPTTFDRS